jgi:apolipoprotein N-acyltransferase
VPPRLLRAAAGVPQALLSSILLALTLPPTNAHVLLWIAWVPLLHALDRAPSRRRAVLCGAVFCALYHFLLFRWTLSMPVLVILFVMLSSVAYGAYFGAAAHALRRRPLWLRTLLLPLLWVAPAVLADNRWFPGFNTVILLLGMHSPLPLPLLQLAHPLGEAGLASFVLLVNALLWHAVEARGRVREAGIAAAGAALLLAGGWTWGAGQVRKFTEAGAPVEKPFRLACAQQDLPFAWEWRASHQEEIYRTYDEMAAKAAARGANMVLFPQYQIPEDIYRHPARWGEIARKSRVFVALGTYAPVVPEHYGAEAWVISLVFAPDGKMIGTHRALHPSPFGRPMVVAGEDAEPIEIPSLGRLAILPCFDDVTPRPTRMFSRSGIDFIAAIANDGLFKGTIHPSLHLIRSRLRAVESRRFLVHCTPNGISAVIDPAGRVLDSLPEGQGLLIHDFPGAKIN